MLRRVSPRLGRRDSGAISKGISRSSRELVKEPACPGFKNFLDPYKRREYGPQGTGTLRSFLGVLTVRRRID